MKRQSNLSLRHRRHLIATACAFGSLLASGAAQAQLSPYFVRISERISYDSNVFRVPESVGERRDGISLTSVTVGIDQPVGRQRFYASATADYTKYKNNDQLDGAGYNLLAGLNWEAASKLSGEVRANFSQAQAALADYGTLQNFSDRNLERAAVIDLRGQYGGASLLALEALANHTSISYSSSAFATRERKSNTLGGGLRYRPNPDLSFGFIVRGTRGEYPQGTLSPAGVLIADEYDRTDIDFTSSYAVSGFSNFYGRISYTKEEHDQQSSRDFSGVTGEIGMVYRPTGKVELGVNLSRETGSGATPGLTTTGLSGSSTASTTTTGAGSGTGSSPTGGTGLTTASGGYLNDARVSDRLRLQGIWDATAKIRVTGAVGYSRDRYDTLFVLNNFGTLSSERGSTRSVNLAARYAATRVWSFECGAGRESRNAGSGLSGIYDYNATTGFCSAALALD